jgi:SynChlorMet cassette protein ScmD
MKLTDKPTIHPQVVLREEFADWAILFQPLTGEAVGLNPAGLAIWKALDGKQSLAEIASAFETDCDGVPDTALENTLEFAQDLGRRLFILTEPAELHPND